MIAQILPFCHLFFLHFLIIFSRFRSKPSNVTTPPRNSAKICLKYQEPILLTRPINAKIAGWYCYHPAKRVLHDNGLLQQNLVGIFANLQGILAIYDLPTALLCIIRSKGILIQLQGDCYLFTGFDEHLLESL